MKRGERVRSLLRGPELLYKAAIEGRYEFSYDQMPVSYRGMRWGKRLNLIKSGLNLVRRPLRPWGMPLHMQFELANYCGLHCPVCPTGTGEMARPRQAMSPHLFRSVMAEVGPYLLTVSLWGWGESLLHPALPEILKAARQYDTAILLSTNGQQLDRDAVVEAILEHPPTYLIVAIDGLTDETNSRFRVGARLEPVLRAVRRLAERKRKEGLALPVLHMRYIVMKHNQHEVDAVPAFARANGFDMISLRSLVVVDSEAARQTHRELVPDIDEYRAYVHRDGATAPRDEYVCMQPFWFPSLLADGTLVACEQDFNASLPLGIVKDRVSFSDLWHSEQASSVRRTIRDTPYRLGFCRNCPSRGRANSDVSVRNESVTGGPIGPVIITSNGDAARS